jgi:hypothetical protein
MASISDKLVEVILFDFTVRLLKDRRKIVSSISAPGSKNFSSMQRIDFHFDVMTSEMLSLSLHKHKRNNLALQEATL